MNADEVIQQIRNDFVRWATSLVMKRLVLASSFFSLPIIGPAVGYLVSLLMDYVAKEFDWAAYFEFKAIKNTIDASRYEDSIRSTREAAEKGDEVALFKARQIQDIAFSRLVVLSN